MADMRRDEINLRKLVGRWTLVTEAHRQALGDGWDIAENLVWLHTSALQRISRAAGSNPSESDKATILLGAHALNLCVETLSLTVRGLFDVASYMLRASFDCQALVYAVAKDEALARKFGKGKLEASAARRLHVRDLRAAGETALANEIDARNKAEAKAANVLTHANVTHVDKIIELGGTTMTPVVAGREDSSECLKFWKAALEHEDLTLSWFHAFRNQALGSDWKKVRLAARGQVQTWFTTN